MGYQLKKWQFSVFWCIGSCVKHKVLAFISLCMWFCMAGVTGFPWSIIHEDLARHVDLTRHGSKLLKMSWRLEGLEAQEVKCLEDESEDKPGFGVGWFWSIVWSKINSWQKSIVGQKMKFCMLICNLDLFVMNWLFLKWMVYVNCVPRKQGSLPNLHLWIFEFSLNMTWKEPWIWISWSLEWSDMPWIKQIKVQDNH